MATDTHIEEQRAAVTADEGRGTERPPRSRMPRLRAISRAAAWVAVAVFLVLLPFQLSDYRNGQLIALCMFTIIVLGLNIVTGYAGQLSLGHGAFVLIGAYVAAILMTGRIEAFTLHPLLAVIAGGIVAAILGIVIGAPSLRVAGPYLAVVTLSLSVAVPIVLKSHHLTSYTAGTTGIVVDKPVPPGPLSTIFSAAEWRYFVALVPAVLLVRGAWNIRRSRAGRAFIALRDSAPGAQMAGVNVMQYKVLAFMLSALYAGFGGGLFALMTGSIRPDSFGVTDSITFLAVIVIGGLGSIYGSIIGGALLAYQVEISGHLASAVPHGEDLMGALYGLLLIIFVVVAPAGIAGLIRRVVPAAWLEAL